MTAPASWTDQLQHRAEQLLEPHVAEYVRQGACASVTVDEATAAWRRVRFTPRVLRDVTDVDLTTHLFGTRYRVPWGVAPTTLQRSIHPDGEVALARACAAAGIPLVVSSNAATPFGDIAATGAPWWLQVYLTRDRENCRGLLERAVDAGARALVLTVDTPVVSTRPTASGRSVWEHVPRESIAVNLDQGRGPGWEKATDLAADDLAWLTRVTGLPVVVKGVLHPDDADLALRAGAAAVWVSNHGGRQLDRAVATADALPTVVATVAGRAPVFVDGGVRNGHDLLAALALGADAVFLGRPALWALALGETGLERWHTTLRSELFEVLQLAGCRTPAAARDAVR